MKKIISLILVICTVLALLSGCGGNDKNDEEKIKITVTSFAAYDWCKNILGDREDSFEICLLADNGIDMHSYQPTAEDILKIYNADIFIYVGGLSDKWVADVLKSPSSKEKITLNMLNAIGSRAILVDEAHHEHDEGEEHTATEYDEHVWLSLKNAVILCEEICKAISKKDSENKNIYEQNLKDYKAEISKIEADSLFLSTKSIKKPLIFADRFPFKYLARDYNLGYYSCFENCTSETEATFDCVIDLSQKVDKYNVEYIFTVDNLNEKLAETVKANTSLKNQKIVTLNSMQSVNLKDNKDGISYISIMRKNIELIIKAL